MTESQTTTTVTFLVECEVVADDENRRQIERMMASHLHCTGLFIHDRAGVAHTIGAKVVHPTDLALHRAGYVIDADEHDDCGLSLEWSKERLDKILRRRPKGVRRKYPVALPTWESTEVPCKGLKWWHIRDIAFEIGYASALESMLYRLRPAFTATEQTPAPAEEIT